MANEPTQAQNYKNGEERPLKRSNITVIKHVKNKLSDDAKAVVEELKKILAEAETGKINGLIYIISRPEAEGGEYVDGAAGIYTRFPTDAVGQLEIVKLKYTRMALDGTR